MKKIFLISGWVLGIASFVIIQQILFESLDAAGIEVVNYFEEEVCVEYREYSDCDDSALTFAGLGLSMISGLGAFAIGYSVGQRAVFPLTPSGKLTFYSLLIGALLFTSLAIVLELILGINWIQRLITIFLLVVIIWKGWKTHGTLQEHLSLKNNQKPRSDEDDY